MTVVADQHGEHGATYREWGGTRVVDHYGRPERTHRAVRNGVGVIEMGYGILEVTGDDRVEFVDNAVSNQVPHTDGQGCYALLLDPQGQIEADLYILNAGERLLLFVPPDRATTITDNWREKTFIQDVTIDLVTDQFAIYGVHGPTATEKIASVLTGGVPPDNRLTFDRGRMGDEGVTVIRGDGLTGEEGYDVVCTVEAAARVFDTLLTHGLNATPFGYRTWGTLTLEAGTPLFETELAGNLPNAVGVRNALDFEKGCYVGQEVVSRIENRGRPPERLVGLRVESSPEKGAAVFEGDAAVGEVTRAVESPSRDEVLALALVGFDTGSTDLTVRVAGQETPASRVDLPFVEGSDRSTRLPVYVEAETSG